MSKILVYNKCLDEIFITEDNKRIITIEEYLSEINENNIENIIDNFENILINLEEIKEDFKNNN